MRGLRNCLPKRALLWVAGGVILIGGGIALMWKVNPPSASHLPLMACSFTGAYWYSKPIYIVDNLSKVTLEQVTISSRTSNFLPMLSIGGTPPASLTTRPPLSAAPYELAPGMKIWFVGPNRPPAVVYVSWLENGFERYETLNIPKN